MIYRLVQILPRIPHDFNFDDSEVYDIALMLESFSLRLVVQTLLLLSFK
jgi:hypothetical protein